MATSNDAEAHRAVIKYCVEREMTPGQTIKEMESSRSHQSVSRVLVYKWHKRYSTGWSESGAKKGRPTEINDAAIRNVSDVIRSDRRHTVREVATITGISKSSVQRILSNNLSMSRVCARWVPRLLTDEQMERRVADSRAFLRRYRRDGTLLNKIITMDETWVHHYEPESKRQSSIWKTPGTPPPKKAKAVKSLGKVMLMVFMDNKGVILSHAVRPGETVNAAYYSQVQWVEQQKLVSRKKRDFLPNPADQTDLHLDVSYGDTNEHSLHRNVRDVKKREDPNRPTMAFNDELYDEMWYFLQGGWNHTDMNVIGAWKKGITGKNVVVTILDDGIERDHSDLKDNYDPYASTDVNGHDDDPMPRYDYTNTNRHGTRCAGEVSAKANNSKCIVGVAYDSKIGGVRMLDGDVFDAVEANSLSFNRTHIDIYSSSWGPNDDGMGVDGPGPLAKTAFIEGIKLGRQGKGSVFVWASGNGGSVKDSCSCDGYTNSIYTLSVSSISQRGDKPWYLEECSSTLMTTYSSGHYDEKQIITLDLHNKCTQTHTGTSASAPLAAGIIALILEANPSLTWRDVQYVTLMTSRPLPDGAWVTNGVGRQVSLRYGYGLMDATAMVELAEKWTNVPEQHICNIVSGTQNIEIPDEGYEEMLDTTACAGTDNTVNFLEHVLVSFTIQSKQRGGLQIYLISPMGTRSIILPHRPNDHDSTKGFKSWAFLSVHFWGENPVGRWKMEIEVSASYQGAAWKTNKLVSWSLILHGTEPNPINLKPVTPGGSSTVQPTASTGKEPTTTLDESNTTTVATTTPPPTTQTAYTQTTVSVETTAEECHPQCVGGCTGPAPSQCNVCANYKMHDSGTCLASCPPAFYGQDSVCRPCPSSCDTCTTVSSSSVMCLTCKPGYLLIEGKGTCEKFCEAGYYRDAGHCRVCSGKCAECSGAEDRCTACRWGLQLLNNACVSQKEPAVPRSTATPQIRDTGSDQKPVGLAVGLVLAIVFLVAIGIFAILMFRRMHNKRPTNNQAVAFENPQYADSSKIYHLPGDTDTENTYNYVTFHEEHDNPSYTDMGDLHSNSNQATGRAGNGFENRIAGADEPATLNLEVN